MFQAGHIIKHMEIKYIYCIENKTLQTLNVTEGNEISNCY